MTKRLLAAAAMVTLSWSIQVFANEPVTLMLRSGERLSGRFADLHNGVVYLRTSQHEEPRIPLEQVALLDFVGGANGLPETELREARGSEHLLLLRDGTSLKGRLVDIEAVENHARLELVFRAENGDQHRWDLNRIGRVYLGSFPGAAAATAPAADVGQSRGITVQGNSRWIDTGLVVREGEMMAFDATGEIRLSTDPNDVAGPAGAFNQRYARRAPLPQHFAGSLIARVGRSAPFLIGDTREAVRMPATGRLQLGVNDDHLNDNTGQFVVSIREEERRGRFRRR